MYRRTFLHGLGLAGLMAWAGIRLGRRPARAQTACTLTPSQTEGPFYFDPELLRRDITEGRPGAPLTMRLQIVDAGSCAPIPNAVVDLWHADAEGLYSGYLDQGDDGVDTSGETFLRGLQVTNGDGIAEFTTIYPGWYRGRTAHIHFKVHVDDRTYVTSQLYFPDDVSARVNETAPYAARGQNPTTNAEDGVLQDGQLEQLLVTITEEVGAYLAVHAIGIDLPQPSTPTAPPPTATAPPSPTKMPSDCAGDCSNDGTVTVDELVRGVNLSLGTPSGEQCAAFDRDGNRLVTIDELVAAVNGALGGCA
jgi:protocatechuate 3,4-dioxygenase beta subunit